MSRFNGYKWVISDNIHAESLGSIGNQYAYGSETYNAQGLSSYFGSGKLTFALFHCLGNIFR